MQLVLHAAIAVAGQFILNVLDDRNKFGIAEIQSPCCGSVVGGTFGEIDHFAPPSDGAGRGPVMMEQFPLSPAIGWRGVFYLYR